MALAQLDNTELRRRYEELRAMRETEPEEHAARMATTLEETRIQSESLVTQLREEIEQHKEREQELAHAVTVAEALHAENAMLRQSGSSAAAPTEVGAKDVERLRQTVAFFELMTGMRVELDQQRARCTCGGGAEEEKQVVFDMDLAPEEGEQGDVEFHPVALGESTSQLPEYMQDSITCELPSAPPRKRRPHTHASELAPHPRAPFLRFHLPASQPLSRDPRRFRRRRPSRRRRAQSSASRRRRCCRRSWPRASVESHVQWGSSWTSTDARQLRCAGAHSIT